jgi:hypothetical protein
MPGRFVEARHQCAEVEGHDRALGVLFRVGCSQAAGFEDAARRSYDRARRNEDPS